jgi:hypothetical protein
LLATSRWRARVVLTAVAREPWSRVTLDGLDGGLAQTRGFAERELRRRDARRTSETLKWHCSALARRRAFVSETRSARRGFVAASAARRERRDARLHRLCRRRAPAELQAHGPFMWVRDRRPALTRRRRRTRLFERGALDRCGGEQCVGSLEERCERVRC